MNPDTASPWQSFWNNYLPHDPVTEEDMFKQVAQTVNRKPIPRERFLVSCDRISSQLELSREDCLVEFCCGNGLVSYELAPRVGRLIGIDFAPRQVEAARRAKSRENTTYLLGDATAPLPAIIRDPAAPHKFLLNNSLAYFKPSQLETILGHILNYLGGGTFSFLLSSVPNFELKDNFYNTPERRARHLANESREPDTNDGLGRWWRPGEIEAACRRHGLGVRIENQPEALSNYRMDALIIA